MNEYGFYEVTDPHDTGLKNGRIYVLPYVKENMFYYDQRIIKCGSANEREVYKQLEPHPSILEYYGVIGDNCILLEYMQDSVDFDDLTANEDFSEIVAQTIDVITHLHNQGFSHNDIHGGNLAWDPYDQRVILFDFESAKQTLLTLDDDWNHVAFVLWSVVDGEQAVQIEDDIANTDSLKRTIKTRSDLYPDYHSEIEEIYSLL